MHERWITDWEPSRRWPYYTRANAGEIAPDPVTPLGWTFAWEHSMCLGWADGYVDMGLVARDQFNPERPETCGTFGGYLYVNLSSARMIALRSGAMSIPAFDAAIFGNPELAPPYEPNPDDERPELAARFAEHQQWVMTTTSWPELIEDRDQVAALRLGRPGFDSLSDADLLRRARDVQPLLRELFRRCSVTSSNSGIAPGVLAAVGDAVGEPGLAVRLLAGMGDVDSAEPARALWALSRQVRESVVLSEALDDGIEGFVDLLAAPGSNDVRRFRAAWDEFLVAHGSRGPNEWDLGAPSWETDPAIAVAALDRLRLRDDSESPTSRAEALIADRRALIATVRDKLSGQPDVAALFEGALVASNMVVWRERTKTTIIRALHEARMAFRALGQRLAEAGHLAASDHVFMLLDGELSDFVADPGNFRDVLAERAAGFARLRRLEPPFVVSADDLPVLSAWPTRRERDLPSARAGEVLHGIPGCPGSATGAARVVRDPSDPSAFEPGAVLVAPLTDPAWTPLFLAAAAVVVEVGGQVSHAVIVSRELGVPCVVSVADATRRIPDGATVTVDGQAGTVTVH